MVSFVLLIGLAIGLILAAVMDVRESRIPNWLTFSLAGFGMAVHGWHQGFNGLILSMEGLAVGILCLIFFYIKGGMGAGDVKLLGAIGAILGPQLVVYVFGFAGVLGGLYSLAMLSSQGGLRYTWDRIIMLLNTQRCKPFDKFRPDTRSLKDSMNLPLLIETGLLKEENFL